MTKTPIGLSVKRKVEWQYKHKCWQQQQRHLPQTFFGWPSLGVNDKKPEDKTREREREWYLTRK